MKKIRNETAGPPSPAMPVETPKTEVATLFLKQLTTVETTAINHQGRGAPDDGQREQSPEPTAHGNDMRCGTDDTTSLDVICP